MRCDIMATLRRYGARGTRVPELLGLGTMACFFGRQMAWNLQRPHDLALFHLSNHRQSAT